MYVQRQTSNTEHFKVEHITITSGCRIYRSSLTHTPGASATVHPHFHSYNPHKLFTMSRFQCVFLIFALVVMTAQVRPTYQSGNIVVVASKSFGTHRRLVRPNSNFIEYEFLAHISLFIYVTSNFLIRRLLFHG
jgi:hypothetical protein